MGSSGIQGPLWGAEAHAWAEIQEQTALPLFGAVLDAAKVTRGTSMLDAGCGSGLPSLLAACRGADVSGIDASEDLIGIASERLPSADMRVGDLEELPYEDATFDAVLTINSVFYAADTRVAMRELARVTRPEGRVVVTTWGPPETCEYGEVMGALGPLLPPPPPDAPPGGPFAFSAPGAIEDLLDGVGLKVAGRDQVECPFIYPSAEVSMRGQLGSGVIQRAIEHSGEEAVRSIITSMDRDHAQSDGSIRYDNTFIWVAAVR